MKIQQGKEAQREWTQYDFKVASKNQVVVVQRNVSLYWFIFHLLGFNKNDGVKTIGGSYKRKDAEAQAHQYIAQLIK